MAIAPDAIEYADESLRLDKGFLLAAMNSSSSFRDRASRKGVATNRQKQKLAALAIIIQARCRARKHRKQWWRFRPPLGICAPKVAQCIPKNCNLPHTYPGTHNVLVHTLAFWSRRCTDCSRLERRWWASACDAVAFPQGFFLSKSPLPSSITSSRWQNEPLVGCTGRAPEWQNPGV